MRSVLKKFTVAVLTSVTVIASIANPAKADHLTYIGADDNNAEYYLNLDTLEQEPSGWIQYSTSMRLNRPSPEGVLYVDFDSKAHCPSSTAGITNIQLYNVNDQLVAQQPQEATYDVVQSGSIEELALDAACRILRTPR